MAAASAVALIGRVLPDRPWEHEQWPLCIRLLEHTIVASGWAEQHDVAREQTARISTAHTKRSEGLLAMPALCLF